MAPKSVGASMLGNPDVPGFGVDGQALGLPVSVAPDFGKYIAFTHKGIVGGTLPSSWRRMTVPWWFEISCAGWASRPPVEGA